MAEIFDDFAFLKVREFATLARIDISSVYRLCRERRIPCCLIAGRIRIPRSFLTGAVREALEAAR